MIKAWNITGKVSTNQLGDNKMAFVFAEEKDMSKVLNNTWTFRDHQTVITWWPPDEAHTDVNLEKARFWLHFFGIAVTYINKENAEAIGNEIGTFIRSDLHSPAQKWRNSLKMQIDLDIHKPLRSTINFTCNGGKQILVEVRYERLIDFCHACGRIGHKNPNCTFDREKKELEAEDNPIGPWLKFEASLIPNPKIARAKSVKEFKMDRNSTSLERPSNPNRISAGTLNFPIPTAGKSVSFPEIGPICNVAIIDSCMPDLQNSTVDKLNTLPQKEFQLLVPEKLSGENAQTGVFSENTKVGEPDNTLCLEILKGQTIGPDTSSTDSGPNMKESLVTKSLVTRVPPASGNLMNRLKFRAVNALQTTTLKLAMTQRGPRNSSMKIFAWNCQGLAQPRAVRALKFLIKESKADVVFISEVKTTLSPLISNSLINLKLVNISFSPPVGKAGGLLLAWKSDISLKVLITNSFFFHSTVTEKNNTWFLTTIYAPCNHQKKDIFWNNMNNLSSSPSNPWMIVGDFNDILDQTEKKGGFEEMWYDDNSCFDVVQKSWKQNVTGSPPFRLTCKIKRVKEDLKVWNRDIFGNCFKRANDINQKISEVRHLDKTDTDGILVQNLLVELDVWLLRAETYWKQKAKEKWIKEEKNLFANPSMKAEFLLFTVILYESIWMARNKLNLGFSPPSSQQLVLIVSRKCKNHWLAMAQTAQGKTQSAKAWKPPPENWTKVNVDAAYSNGNAFTGMVLRNNNGSFLHAAAYKHHCLDSLSAECLAILEACKTLEALNYKSVIIESDSLNVISFINVDSSNSFWTAAPLVEKI
ncbi:hypothetical protein CASFOL_000961 [Castilleja foliolosa]|uniref:CCHC-type domain-containing protein n=1 Tax=Castilleja foliolosa TaxID=1961234 RepID=A0ABD3ELP8_9LAMI